MIRKLMVAAALMFCLINCAEAQKVPPPPATIYLGLTGNPTAGTKYANGSTFTPAANYTLINNPSSWVYIEISSTDPGNNYFWGDAAEAFVGNGTVYFGTSNPLPPGNYEMMVYSLTYSSSDTISFVITP